MLRNICQRYFDRSFLNFVSENDSLNNVTNWASVTCTNSKCQKSMLGKRIARHGRHKKGLDSKEKGLCASLTSHI